MLQLAAYKGTTRLFDRVVQAWTLKRYSHCEIVVNGISYSSSMRDKGVRAKYIEMSPDNWDLFPINFATEEQVLSHYIITEHNGYGYTDLIVSQVLNIKLLNSRSEFCSEWCAAALGFPNPEIYNPGNLVDQVLFTNSIIGK